MYMVVKGPSKCGSQMHVQPPFLLLFTAVESKISSCLGSPAPIMLLHALLPLLVYPLPEMHFSPFLAWLASCILQRTAQESSLPGDVPEAPDWAKDPLWVFSQEPVHPCSLPLLRYLTSPGYTPVYLQGMCLNIQGHALPMQGTQSAFAELSRTGSIRLPGFVDVVPCCVFLSPFLIFCFQVSLFNYVFLISWAFALPYTKLRRLASSVCTVWTCVIIVCKMLYQLQTIKPENFSVNCSLVSLRHGVGGAGGASLCLAFREGMQILGDTHPRNILSGLQQLSRLEAFWPPISSDAEISPVKWVFSPPNCS